MALLLTNTYSFCNTAVPPISTTSNTTNSSQAQHGLAMGYLIFYLYVYGGGAPDLSQ